MKQKNKNRTQMSPFDSNINKPISIGELLKYSRYMGERYKIVDLLILLLLSTYIIKQVC